MRSALPKWLCAVSLRDTDSAANAVSLASVVSPDMAKVVSGVSRGARVSAVVGPLAVVALSLYATSCAEPKLDGLPEDPGQQVPLPTIGPVNPNTGIGGDDAGNVETPTKDNTDDEASDASAIVPPDDVDEFDAGAPEPGTSSTAHPTSGTGTSGTHTSAPSSTGAPGTSNTSDDESSDTTETSEVDLTSDTDTTVPTDTDTSELTTGVEADAGGYPVYDAGVDTGEGTDTDGDAGDAGMDGSVDGGLGAGDEP